MKPSRAPAPSKDGEATISPGLYLVATPIGNAMDLGMRAIAVLKAANLVACEDTRKTGTLLSIHGISQKLTPYHDHNGPRARPRLLQELEKGAVIALVSDAGTPAISDPGYKLVRACIDQGIAVTSVPGPTAVIAALVVSGLPTDKFFFAGFLPNRRAARQRELESLREIPGTLIIQESARRLPDSLADMLAALGPRPAAVTRELTKLHEEIRRGSLEELSRTYAQDGPPKGEVVVVIGPAEAPTPARLADLDEMIRMRLSRESMRDVTRAIAQETGLPRGQVYTHILEVARQVDDET